MSNRNDDIEQQCRVAYDHMERNGQLTAFSAVMPSVLAEPKKLEGMPVELLEIILIYATYGYFIIEEKIKHRLGGR